MIIKKRHVLKPGTSLFLDGRKCMILGVMGSGTSCIAYKAQMKLTIKNQTILRTIVLKELYPAHLSIIRGTDNSLIVPDSSKSVFEKESESFVKAAVLQFEFHNEEDLTNFTSDIEVVYELNNTLYSVTGIVSGRSYDKVEPENVTSILKVGRALSRAISYYHKNGYLNLDIKPANIYNLPETDELVQLFDFNTVCTKEEASQGKFSYSEGYAAPEVKAAKKGGGKLSEIGEQADIYSIGAVIFEKIMGRIPKVADQRVGKRWKLETNPYLKDAVPQLQNGITQLFRKTLAIDKKDRYYSATELKKSIEKLIKLTHIDTFLKNQKISPCTPKDIYIPRKDVLSEMVRRLEENHILYLYAIGGIGKSETAREYAEQYADQYDFIQSVFYSYSLKKTIANLDFVGMKAEDRYANTDEEINRLYDLKYDYLGNTSLYGTNTLLIIDNYDYNVDPTSEEYRQNYDVIQALKKLNIHIILTTRVKPKDPTECLDLEDMSLDELRALFFKINPEDKDIPERISLVNEIIELSYRHTMTVKLIAMQSARYKKTLDEYRNVLKNNGLNSGIKGRITNEKDDESVTMTAVYDHIKALFDFNDLNDKQRYIMVNACLLPLEGLEANVFSEYIDLEHFDSASDSDCLDESIVDLINRGWIALTDTANNGISKDSKITLHPLICDIVTNELKPELMDDKCRKFYVSFLDLIQEWGNNKANGIKSDEQEKLVYVLYKPMCSVFENSKVTEAINYILITCDVFRIENQAIIVHDKLECYFGVEKELTIPESVTEVGECAFKYCFSLTKVFITNVTEIGMLAFSSCSSLKEINIFASVKTIAFGVFSDCFSLEKITIPDNIVEIGNWAFAGCSSLKEISISNNVTRIGDGTFSGCSLLEKITIPDSVTQIGERAFYECSSLKEVTISKNVTRIGDSAFRSCSSLKEITIPDSVTQIGERAFFKCLSLIKIIIPDSVTHIGDWAFDNCSSLTEAIISNNIIITGNWIFSGCSSLKEITIPDSVIRIGDGAFSGCSSLKEITISKNVTRIGDGAFSGCSLLKEITIPDSVTRIGNRVFTKCSSLINIFIPDSVTQIGDYAFSHCISLNEIVISNNNTKIGNSIVFGCLSIKKITYINDDTKTIVFNSFDKSSTEIILPSNTQKIYTGMFYDFSLLKKIIIPDSVNDIDNGAFFGCSSLNEITISKNVTRIGNGAFSYCSSLKKITIPDSVSQIGNCVFSHCSLLSSIELLCSVSRIGNSIFSGCSSLKEIKIPDSVTQIGNRAFFMCSSLIKINIPDSVTQIGNEVFSGCSSLTSVIIPDNVTRIGHDTFYKCSLIKEINCLGSITQIESSLFSGCFSLLKVNIPKSVTGISDNAFENCSSLSKIDIPESVTRIGNNAFDYCSSLQRIHIHDGVTRIGSAAFFHCSSLTSVELSSRITQIDDFVFSECTALTSIELPSCIIRIGKATFKGCLHLPQIEIPNSVTRIENSAFENCISLSLIIISKSIEYLGDEAFFGCTALNKITILSHDVELGKVCIGYYLDDEGLYKKNTNLVIEGYAGSTAEQYAKENGFRFVTLD